MTDDGGSKTWVTIKIPKQTRDHARQLPQTYSEIMQAGIDVLEGRPLDEGEYSAERVAELVVEELQKTGGHH